jgi:spore coat polysaccharide biosynthesis protein SpsF
MERKLIAALACRNKGSRLYGKPLQNLDVKNGIKVIDHIIDHLKETNIIDNIVLGIAEGIENEIYKEIAIEKNVDYIVGDETDVLKRLILCGEHKNATDIFRVTSESPFLFYQSIDDLWKLYKKEKLDAIFQDDIIDGCGYEIISLNALKKSYKDGEDRHRSELCTLYIRENQKSFKIKKIKAENKFNRKDLRFTVDNPEDLILCRELYKNFKHQSPRINIEDLIDYMDKNPSLIDLTSKYTEEGYKTMYV